MGEIIHIRPGPKGPPNNVIASKPWEFRKAAWETGHFIQMLRSQSVRLEEHRTEVFQKGGNGVWNLPPHFVLRGGMGCTIHAIFAYLYNGEKMREVYYLAGLMDCMINRVNPLGFFGMVHVLEGTSISLADHAANRIRESLALPKKAFSYLYSHGALDLEHVQFFEKLMNRIEDTADQDQIVHAANVFYGLYGDIFRSLEGSKAPALAA